ncbi:MAG: NAD(P)/FAD-dependent oxidoreductase, partial [Spirochaetia bacterium]|nr:NAD(P)/FAD-dependent oxidoreductase [Spirochaetia bacterium]
PKEKKLGQIFPVSDSAEEVRTALLGLFLRSGGRIFYDQEILGVEKVGSVFQVKVRAGANGEAAIFQSPKLLVATGGKAYPQLGATDFALKLAMQFGLRVTDTAPALVPLTFGKKYQSLFRKISGLSLGIRVSASGLSARKISFDENLLFAHFGLTGPAILQISSYWREKEKIKIRFFPQVKGSQDAGPSSRVAGPSSERSERTGDRRERPGQEKAENETSLEGEITRARETNPLKKIRTFLAEKYSDNFLEFLEFHIPLPDKRIADLRREERKALVDFCEALELSPTGTMGYAKAEVMRGGVDTAELQAATMECKKVPGLYFAGEAVDVTGWLGGYNFQWAWASGFVAGKNAL